MFRFLRQKSERSNSGAPVYRHRPHATSKDTAALSDEESARFGQHLARFVGGETLVFHELVSNDVRIDIQVFQPSLERPYYTLVTSGMSARPMSMPREVPLSPYSELLLCLPADWQLGGPGDSSPLQDPNNYWPIRLLKDLARLPHTYQTWLAPGHTIPNGDPATPYALNTKLSGALVGLPLLFDPGLQSVQLSPSKTVLLYSVIPLYAAEMAVKLEHGVEALLPLMETAGVTEFLNPQRPNLVGRQSAVPRA